MISILAQERLLGFALGSVSMGAFVLHQHRSIYRSLADTEAAAGASSYQPSEIISGRRSPDLAHVWNKVVDETLGRLVVYLGSRGWIIMAGLINDLFIPNNVLVLHIAPSMGSLRMLVSCVMSVVHGLPKFSCYMAILCEIFERCRSDDMQHFLSYC